MKFTVFSPDGTTSREQEFDGVPTFDGDKGLQAVKEVIVAINANNRLGTHSTKTRAEVSGGGRKPWRQKGTGRARAGSSRSPLWSGGGVVFGPKPRDYNKKINGKVRALAFSRALYDRATAGEIAVIENFGFTVKKTKVVGKVVGLIAPKGKILLVDAPFAAVDVLPDPRIRQELSALSDWPTIPQLFVDGELVGGCDIVIEMFESGELAQALL